jgi:hypothetical protein
MGTRYANHSAARRGHTAFSASDVTFGGHA